MHMHAKKVDVRVHACMLTGRCAMRDAMRSRVQRDVRPYSSFSSSAGQLSVVFVQFMFSKYLNVNLNTCVQCSLYGKLYSLRPIGLSRLPVSAIHQHRSDLHVHRSNSMDMYMISYHLQASKAKQLALANDLTDSI